jgi:RHH-type rel operon transcriptional repressor/antitoxin RelB
LALLLVSHGFRPAPSSRLANPPNGPRAPSRSISTASESRLERLAKKTGRTKTFYVREAILEHLEDLEDIYLASQRLERPAKTYLADEVKHELGL